MGTRDDGWKEWSEICINSWDGIRAFRAGN